MEQLPRAGAQEHWDTALTHTGLGRAVQTRDQCIWSNTTCQSLPLPIGLHAAEPHLIQHWFQYCSSHLWNPEQFGLERTLKNPQPQSLLWGGTPPTSPGCSKPHPAWPWMLTAVFSLLSRTQPGQFLFIQKTQNPKTSAGQMNAEKINCLAPFSSAFIAVLAEEFQVAATAANCLFCQLYITNIGRGPNLGIFSKSICFVL